MYGKFENGIILLSDTELDGYAPMIHTEPPEVEEGYEALFYWKIEPNAITQTWEVVEVSEAELSDEEALSILTGEVEP